MPEETLTVNGVANIPVNPQMAADEENWTLIFGTKVTVARRPTGADVLKAQQLLPPGSPRDDATVQTALIAVVCQVDGKFLPYEMLTQMDAIEFIELHAHFNQYLGKKKPSSPAPQTSPLSSTSDSSAQS